MSAVADPFAARTEPSPLPTSPASLDPAAPAPREEARGAARPPLSCP